MELSDSGLKKLLIPQQYFLKPQKPKFIFLQKRYE